MTEDRRVTCFAGALAAAISVAAFAVVCYSGTTLYFGDAVAHLNIGRKILDSKSPGWLQLGTVWLPLPHLLTALTSWIDPLWRSGAAGALPSMAGFVAGAVFLFRITRRETESPALAWASLGIYALNLNLLYLQSTPLTEAQMIGCLLGAVWYAGEGRAIPAGLWLMAGTLTRYDAWFYIPFIALYFLCRHDLRRAVVFGAVASLGPLFWLIHNQIYYGNPLEWFNGPYSAAAIAARSNPGRIGTRYPGDHDLWTALIYYWKAVRLTSGNVPAWLAVAGSAVVMWRRRGFSPLLLLWLPMVFYTASIAYGSVPLFVPQWWPQTYYNTRYALHVLPVIAALAPAVLLPLAARRWRECAALALVLFVAAGWVIGYSKSRSDAVIVFREAQENSYDRRLAVEILARYLQRGCREIWMGGGDWAGALTESGIPFSRVIHDGNRALWKQVKLHPESMVDCVVEQKGDGANEAIAKLPSFEQSFRVALDFSAPGVAELRLWKHR